MTDVTGTEATLLRTGWEPGAPANDTVTFERTLVDSRSVYEGLGFVAVARWTLWTRPAR